MTDLKQIKVVDVESLQIDGNQLELHLRINLQGHMPYHQTQVQTFQMNQLELSVLSEIVRNWIQIQIRKSKSNTNFYIVALENLDDFIQKQNEVEVVDFIEADST